MPRPQNLEVVQVDEELIQLPLKVCVDVMVRNGFFISYIFSKMIELKMLWDQDIWIILTLLDKENLEIGVLSKLYLSTTAGLRK